MDQGCRAVLACLSLSLPLSHLWPGISEQCCNGDKEDKTIISVLIYTMPLIASILYNMCSTQVFPDEFHLAALGPFLEGVCRLKEKVRVRPILESLMERIGNYVEEHPDTLPRDVRYG